MSTRYTLEDVAAILKGEGWDVRVIASPSVLWQWTRTLDIGTKTKRQVCSCLKADILKCYTDLGPFHEIIMYDITREQLTYNIIGL